MLTKYVPEAASFVKVNGPLHRSGRREAVEVLAAGKGAYRCSRSWNQRQHNRAAERRLSPVLPQHARAGGEVW
jgi:hypothetical protein